MILLDTSVVVDYLRSGDARILALFQSQNGAICGVTRAEILAGARSAAHRPRLVAALDAFHQVPMPDSVWDAVGTHLTALRASGITVPLADAIIATVAVEHDIELWTRDRQFSLMQPAMPRLRLFQEPP